MNGAQAPRVVSGTVVRVLNQAGPGRTWCGLVRTPGTSAPAFLSLDRPPGTLLPGDDVHVAGTIVRSEDPELPDEVVPDTDDAEARLVAMAAPGAELGFETSLGHPADAARRLGLATLAGLAENGLVALVARGAAVGVHRDRESPDPAISWAMGRFSDPSCADLRSSAILVMEPTALSPRNAPAGPRGIVQRVAGHLRKDKLRRQREDERRNGADPVAAGLPAAQPDAARVKVASRTLDPRPMQSTIGGPGADWRGPPSLVVPYDPTDTGVTFWRKVTGLRGGYMPRAVPSAEARARITSAHELAHAHQWVAGYRYGDPAEVNASESFADAAALILYVLDTGDEASARAWSDARSLAVLSGVGSHATGPACHAAVDAALALRERQGATGLREALDTAHAISLRYRHPDPEELGRLASILSAARPGWQQLDAATLASAVTDAAATMARSSSLHLHACAEALGRTATAPGDHARQSAIAEATALEAADIADTSRRLRALGCGGMIPDMHARVRADVSDESAPVEVPRDHPGLTRARRAGLARAEREWVVVGPGAPMPSRARIVSAFSDPVPQARTPFDIPVPDRMRRLGELAFRESAMLRARGEAAALAETRDEIREIAWTLAVETKTRDSLRQRYGRDAADALLRLAKERPRTLPGSAAAILESETLLAVLPLLQDAATAWDLELHGRWRRGEPGGRRLDWSGRDLRWMDLAQTDLEGVALEGAAMPDTGRLASRPTLRHALIDGALKLHCEDDWAVSCPDGTRRAFVDGSPALVVEFVGEDGVPRCSGLLPSRSWDDTRARAEFGPGARTAQPCDEHFRAIRRAAPSDRNAGTFPVRASRERSGAAAGAAPR